MKVFIKVSFITTVFILLLSTCLLVYNILILKSSGSPYIFNFLRIILFLFVVLMFLITRVFTTFGRYGETYLNLTLPLLIPAFTLIIALFGELLTVKSGDYREFILFYILELYYVLRFSPKLLKLRKVEHET